LLFDDGVLEGSCWLLQTLDRFDLLFLVITSLKTLMVV
jgi:hypothetical protein